MRKASTEGITSKVFRAVAHKIVFFHLTQGISATCLHTWVTALTIDTSQNNRAVRVADALRATIWWLVIIIWKTLAHWTSLNYPAIGVWSTGAWITWVFRLGWQG